MDPGDAGAAALPPFETGAVPVTVDQLVRFLKNPVKEFFRARLHVTYRDDDAAVDDDEVFALAGLADWQLLDELVADPQASPAEEHPPGAGQAGPGQDIARVVQARLARVAGSGRLPMAGPGQRVADELQRSAEPMLTQWQALHAQYDRAAPQQPLVVEHAGVRLQDWLDGLRTDGHETVWISSSASRLMTRPNAAGERHPRPDRLLDTWVRLLAAGACGVDAQAILLGRDACLQLAPLPRGEAGAALAELLAVWRDGMQRPLPLPCRTGLAAAAGDDAEATYEGSSYSGMTPECAEACLARTYPDFEALVSARRPAAADPPGPAADGGDDAAPVAGSLFLDLALRIHAPLLAWADSCHQVRPWAGADFTADDDGRAPAAGARSDD
jgi:exodeoxyribonuclease V gamma subunit